VTSRLGASTATSNSSVAESAAEADGPDVRTPAPSGGAADGVQPADSFVAPTVTYGSGRALGGADQPAVAANPVATPWTPGPELESAAVPPAALPAAPPPTALREAASPEPEFVDRIWSPLRPAFPGGLVFGIAALVLGPLAGVWLGYRQARAAGAAAQLADR
jgi:hypothetical protein